VGFCQGVTDGCSPYRRCLINNESISPKRCSTTPARRKRPSQYAGGGSTFVQGRVSRRSDHVSPPPTPSRAPSMMRHHQPSVEPLIFTCQRATNSLLYYGGVSRRFGRRTCPVEHGRDSRVLRRLTCPGSTRRSAGRHMNGRNCESETPTGLRQPAFVVSVTGSASDLLVVRSH
jgi:hypothetical protein